MLENHMVLGSWCDDKWDCECSDATPEIKCDNCIIHDPDYFVEPDCCDE